MLALRVGRIAEAEKAEVNDRAKIAISIPSHISRLVISFFVRFFFIPILLSSS